MGGRFALSDDSHGTDQIGTNYPRLMKFIQTLGIKELYYVDRDATSIDDRFSAGLSRIAVADLLQLPFWTEAQ